FEEHRGAQLPELTGRGAGPDSDLVRPAAAVLVRSDLRVAIWLRAQVVKLAKWRCQPPGQRMADSGQYSFSIRRANECAKQRVDQRGVQSMGWIIGAPRLKTPTWNRLFKTGYIDVTGVVRNVLPGEQPVFAVRPPNTLRTTPLRFGNLRDRWATTYDASMIKSTRIRENITTQFRFEAFNATNTPIFSSYPNLTPTSTNFGKIIRDNGQSNAARSIQFGFRVMF